MAQAVQGIFYLARPNKTSSYKKRASHLQSRFVSEASSEGDDVSMEAWAEHLWR